jgi:hypothetical protein
MQVDELRKRMLKLIGDSKNKLIASIDYSGFETHIPKSLIDLMKDDLCMSFPISTLIRERDHTIRSAYLSGTSDVIIDKCLSLCSGEYLTNIIAAIFQKDRIESSVVPIGDYVYFGDDSALQFENKRMYDLFNLELSQKGSITKLEKESLTSDYLLFNRRI